MEASHQWAELLETLQDWQHHEDNDDKWTYIWGTGAFSTKQAYSQIIGLVDAAIPFKWLWDSKCQGKHKVFFWLLMNDRLNTRNLLRRKKFVLPSVHCVLCSTNNEETIKHLMFECPFAQLC